MTPVTIILSVIAVVLVYVILTWKPRLRHIPGHPCNPIYGHLLEIKIGTLHKQLEQWSKLYGPIIRLQLVDKTRVVFNDFHSIYQVLVTKGRDFAGRPEGRRGRWLVEDTGILLSSNADDTWKSLRKQTHRHLKQYGEGLSRLQMLISQVAEDMFDEFHVKIGQEYDPHQVVFDTALKSIALLITGVRPHTGDPIVEQMRVLERDAPKYFLSAQLKYFVYEVLPSLRFLRLSGYRDIVSILDLEADIWRSVQQVGTDDPDAESLVNVLLGPLTEHKPCGYKAIDVRKTAMSLLFAGVTTTSNTFYAAINILAHHPEVQTSVYQEISDLACNRPVTLQDRANLPYAHAFLLELLRYSSVVALGIPHKAVRDTTISGYHIPKGTIVYANLWALHHEEPFWGDPYDFRPERFLDQSKNIVTADHPNRKHLMPFGAGIRVCLGESLALARLFLWITTLVQRFKIDPAADNVKHDVDPRRFILEAVLRPIRYKVVFNPRE